MMAKDNGELLPVVECDRDLVEYHNRGSLIKGFDQVGYFIYEGAVICEKGQGEAIRQKIEDSSTFDNFSLRQRKVQP